MSLLISCLIVEGLPFGSCSGTNPNTTIFQPLTLVNIDVYKSRISKAIVRHLKLMQAEDRRLFEPFSRTKYYVLADIGVLRVQCAVVDLPTRFLIG